MQHVLSKLCLLAISDRLEMLEATLLACPVGCQRQAQGADDTFSSFFIGWLRF